MDQRQLKAFIAVFEERNITAASRRMHLSQPALSATIKILEETLGTQLFQRQARGVEVTEDARALYPQAQRMVAESEGLVRRFREHKHRVPVEIGIENDIAGSMVEAFVRLAGEAIPTLLLDVQEGCVGDARLASEDQRCEDELFLPLWTEPYVLALPLGHALTFADLRDPPDVSQARWVMCPEHSSHQRLLPLYGTSAGSPAAYAGSFRLALALTAAGRGWSVVPQSLAHHHEKIEQRLLPGIELNRRIGLCFPLQALEKSSIMTLYELLREATLRSPAHKEFDKREFEHAIAR